MILDLVRKLSSVDSSLSLAINYSDDGVVTFTVRDDMLDLYSYSSTDSMECYSKVLHYIDCVQDSDKFIDLIRQIEFEPLGV